MMRMLDLFSGIGGFSLAAEWVWGEKLTIEAFVEIDAFCQKVLTKNFPGVPIYEDIKKIQWFVANNECLGWEERARKRIQSQEQITERQNIGNFDSKRIAKISTIDLLTGGFPCQPFSIAGKRKGTQDDRYLWPEMLRTICEVRPRWIVAENVRGLISLQDGMVFEGVFTDLENEGYEVISFVLPACAQGAPHRRDRVWIVARDSNPTRCNWDSRTKQEISDKNTNPNGSNRYVNNTNKFNGDDAGQWFKQVPQFQKAEVPGCNAANTESRSRQIWGTNGSTHEEGRRSSGQFEGWNEHWYEVASRLCRVDDGVSSRVDRTKRLKALGNAIVPQIAYQIFMVIKKLEEENLFNILGD